MDIILVFILNHAFVLLTVLSCVFQISGCDHCGRTTVLYNYIRRDEDICTSLWIVPYDRGVAARGCKKCSILSFFPQQASGKCSAKRSIDSDNCNTNLIQIIKAITVFKSSTMF